MPVVTKWLIGAVTASLASCGNAALFKGYSIHNEEFGLSATFPFEPVCSAYSGEHLTGYYVSLDGKTSCNDKEYGSVERYISVSMSYNTGMLSDRDTLPDKCTAVSPDKLSLSSTKLRGNNKNWIGCVMNDGSSVVIYVNSRKNEGKYGEIDFLFALGTDKIHYDRDLVLFGNFLESTCLDCI